MTEAQQSIDLAGTPADPPGAPDKVTVEAAAGGEGTPAAAEAPEISPADAQAAQPAPKPKRKAKTKPRRSPAALDEAAAPDLAALAAKLDAQAAQLTTTADETSRLKNQLRAAAIEKLQILAAYRSDVPDFDVTTTEGRADLEQWAAARPEIRNTHPVPAAPMVRAEDALKDLKSPHLVNVEWYKRALAEA